MQDAIHDTAEAISLFATWPLLVMSAYVIFKFSQHSWNASKTYLSTGSMEATDWLILGVFVSFVGSGGDNTYWGVAWSSSFIDSPWTEFLFHNGVYSNIPFRQVATVIAAYCHIRSIKASEGTMRLLWVIGLMGGMFHIGLLLWCRL